MAWPACLWVCDAAHQCLLQTKKVEIKTTSRTTSADVLQKAADFVHAFLLGERGEGLWSCGPSRLRVGLRPHLHWSIRV